MCQGWCWYQVEILVCGDQVQLQFVVESFEVQLQVQVLIGQGLLQVGMEVVVIGVEYLVMVVVIEQVLCLDGIVVGDYYVEFYVFQGCGVEFFGEYFVWWK